MKKRIGKSWSIFDATGAAAFVLFLVTASAPLTAQSADTEVTITPAEALELSSGKVVLHFGDGFSPSTLTVLKDLIENLGLVVENIPGGPENEVQFYFFKNDIGNFTFENSTEILTLSEIYAERYQLGIFSPEN